MGAFIIAGLVFLVTLLICFLELMSGYMSTTGQGGIDPTWTFIIGMILTGLIIASHWMPHIGW